MGDVSKKLMDQFSSNLNEMLDEQGAEPAAEPAAEAPTVRKIDGPAAEPVDLADMAGPALLKRIGPAVLALVLILVLLRRRR